MTAKSTKISIIVMVAIATLGSTVFVLNTSFAQPALDPNKDIIKEHTITATTEDRLRLQSIIETVESGDLTDEQKIVLEDEIKQIRERAKANAPTIDTEIEDMIQDKRVMLREHINVKPFTTDNFEIGSVINTISVDKRNKSLEVGIDPEIFKERNYVKIFNDLRDIVGNDIKISIVPITPATPLACSQTGDCNPLQGGVKIQAEQYNPCSSTFKAKKVVGSTTYTGFVTAGHCGDYNKKVGNPDSWWWNHMGTVKDSEYHSNSKCDCAFVDATETISDKIYSNIEPDVVLDPADNDYVVMKGYTTGSLVAQVSNTSIDVRYTSGVLILDMIELDDDMAGGDSGGPVYESTTSNNDLYGIIGAANSATQKTYASKASNLDDEISGASFDFS